VAFSTTHFIITPTHDLDRARIVYHREPPHSWKMICLAAGGDARHPPTILNPCQSSQSPPSAPVQRAAMFVADSSCYPVFLTRPASCFLPCQIVCPTCIHPVSRLVPPHYHHLRPIAHVMQHASPGNQCHAPSSPLVLPSYQSYRLSYQQDLAGSGHSSPPLFAARGSHGSFQHG
jgi:hypothetical protein